MPKFEEEQYAKRAANSSRELEVIPADNPQGFKLNWKVTELAGIAIANSKGVKWVKVRKPKRPIIRIKLLSYLDHVSILRIDYANL